MNMILAALLVGSAPLFSTPVEVLAQDQALFPTDIPLTYASCFDDGYVSVWGYHPSRVAVRFAVPVSGSDNAIVVKALEFIFYINFNPHLLGREDSFEIYLDGPGGTEPGPLVNGYFYSLNDLDKPGAWRMQITGFNDTIPASHDTAVVWFVQPGAVAWGEDSLIRCADTTEADSFTLGYNFVDYQNQGWADLFLWGQGNDFAVMLYYELASVDVAEGNSGPAEFSLFPNPARKRCTVRMNVSVRGNFTLDVYDPAGRRISQPFSGELGPGPHALNLDISGLAPGIYFLRVSGPRGAENHRLVVE